MKRKKIFLAAGLVVGLAIGLSLVFWALPQRKIAYADPISSLGFYYPKYWGAPAQAPGNNLCPEEDTYRTPETLSIFDREIKFPDLDLKDTDSFIRMGIRFYKINPKVSNNCNDDVLLVLAKREMTGEEFSSFKLSTANQSDYYGVYNQNASRLNTEYRPQYTFFRKEKDGSISAVQPFLSFIPYADSPEWKEIESEYKGDIAAYIREAESAARIRTLLLRFEEMVKTIK